MPGLSSALSNLYPASDRYRTTAGRTRGWLPWLRWVGGGGARKSGRREQAGRERAAVPLPHETSCQTSPAESPAGAPASAPPLLYLHAMRWHTRTHTCLTGPFGLPAHLCRPTPVMTCSSTPPGWPSPPRVTRYLQGSAQASGEAWAGCRMQHTRDKCPRAALPRSPLFSPHPPAWPASCPHSCRTRQASASSTCSPDVQP